VNHSGSRGFSGGAAALSRNASGLLPEGLFGRMLMIVVACVAIPAIIALMIAPEAHRASLLGSFFMLLPPLACGVYFAARSVTRPLSKLTDEADSLGKRVEMGTVQPTGPRELRLLESRYR
jgi:hypothetical protein